MGMNEMKYKEAADIIDEYIANGNIVANNTETRIVSALLYAVDILRKLSLIEDGVITKGTSIWYVDFEYGYIEKGTVFSVLYKDGKLESFSVDFDKSGDFDEFYGSAVGKCFFLSEDAAKYELISKKNS